jgi:predicted CopG family antitoxin
MAVKTITIDLEAYELLARSKREGQSFSQVIKEYFHGSGTGRDLKAALREVRLSASTLDAVDHLVEARENDPARAPEL